MTIKNLRILVTRSKPFGELLCEKIEALGGVPLYFPTIAILPPKNITAFKQKISQLDRYQRLIFISPQAVLNSTALIQQTWPQGVPAKIAVLGAGTANALKKAHLPVMYMPKKDWTSEGLLDLADFQQLKNVTIAIIKGTGGRPFLKQELMKRGAKVTSIIAYRREPIALDVSYLIDQKIDIITAVSNEGLRNLKNLSHIPLVVISERMKTFAEKLGFKKILLAQNASDDAILHKIVHKIKENL